jgi:integrase core domain protein
MDLLLRRIVNLAFDMFPRTHIGQYSEIKRGSVVQIRQGKACIIYVADSGQLTYGHRCIGSFNAMKLGNIEPFICWIEERVYKDHRSFDAAIGYALLRVKAIDLLLVVHRSMRKSIVKKISANWGNP